MLASFRRRLLVRLVMFVDLCVFTLALVIAFLTNTMSLAYPFLERLLNLQFQVKHIVLFLIMAFLWHLLFKTYDLYESRRLQSGSKYLKDILKAATWGTVVFALLGIGFRIAMINIFSVIVFWTLSALLTILFRSMLHAAEKILRKHGKNRRYLLIVGTNEKAYSLAQMVEEKKELGYCVIGHLDNKVHLDGRGMNLLGTLADFPSIMKNHVIDEIVITLPVRSLYEEIEKIVRLAEEQGIKTKYMADIFNTKGSRTQSDAFEEHPVMTAISSRQKEWKFIQKRMADTILASVLLIVLSPLTLLTALVIKMTSPGPVFFVQNRVGFNKRRFRLYKFRTMVPDAEKLQAKVEHLNEMDGPVFKISNDPRITPVGKWLRKTSIDELPQLFNVIKGDMSLVGPRPLPVRDYDGFDKDWQRRRFSVLPGITCIWQISGRNNVAFEEWMKMDMEYIENWTLLYDFKILLKTIPAVIKKRGAA